MAQADPLAAYLSNKSKSGSTLLLDEEHQHGETKRPIPSRNPRLLPRKGRRTAFWQRRGDDTWTWEVLCTLLSVLCIIAIATILKVYEGRKPPSLPGGVTINAIVSVLSTISKSGLIFSVSAAIGQTKWDWYEKEPRPLYDMEIFDEASRGPLGAAKLLLRRRIMASLAPVGAIVLILALAVDPFIQQVISFSTIDVLARSEAVWTERLTRPSFIPTDNVRSISAVDSSIDTELVDTLSGAVWNDASIYDRRAYCPSGNCEFESFSTFEFCADTEVVSDLDSVHWNCSAKEFAEFRIAVSNTTKEPRSVDCNVWVGPQRSVAIPFQLKYKYYAVSLPPGPPNFESYGIEFPTSILDDMTERVESPGPTGKATVPILNSLITLGYVRFSIPATSVDIRNLKIEWAEWATIRPCKTTYTVSVVNGSTSAQPSSSSPMKLMFISNQTTPGLSANFKSGESCWAPEGEEIRNMPISPLQGNGSSVFTSNATTMAFCQSGMRERWASLISRRLSSVAKWENDYIRNKNTSAKTREWLFGGFSNTVSGDGSQDVHVRVGKHTLGPVVRSMAAALNNISRVRSQEEPVAGFEKTSETVLDVRWVWLAFPIAVQALGVAFLLIVIFRKRSTAGLWKDSLLAAVYNGLDRKDDKLHRQNLWAMPDINDMARATRVQLLVKATEDGGKVVLGSPAQGR